MNRFLTRILLLVAGLMLFVIGAATLLVPHAFFAESGVTLGHNPSLLSEIRAPGGLLVGCAVVVLLGALWRSIRRQALMLAAMVYGEQHQTGAGLRCAKGRHLDAGLSVLHGARRQKCLPHRWRSACTRT